MISVKWILNIALAYMLIRQHYCLISLQKEVLDAQLKILELQNKLGLSPVDQILKQDTYTWVSIGVFIIITGVFLISFTQGLSCENSSRNDFVDVTFSKVNVIPEWHHNASILKKKIVRTCLANRNSSTNKNTIHLPNPMIEANNLENTSKLSSISQIFSSIKSIAKKFFDFV